MATDSLDRLSAWFESASGQRLLAEQAPLVSEYARRFHGDTLLWAGCHSPLEETVRGCMVRHRIFLEPGSRNLEHRTRNTAADSGKPLEDGSRIVANLHELPLPNNSVDAVVLHHALETAQDPRTAIREVARVLCPGGRLVLVAFNPWSLWGLRGAYARLFRDTFSGLRFLSARRLLDWLTVLSFEADQDVKYFAYELPIATRFKDARFWTALRSRCAERALPVGGAYVIAAVKQAHAVRPDWSGVRAVSTARLAPATYPRVSARIARFPLRGTTSRGLQDPS